MYDPDLQRNPDAQRPLTDSAGLDRLLAMMARWWEGWSLAQIAREHGVRRQRVAAILAGVDCTRLRWCRADQDRPDSGRRAHPLQIAQARQALLERYAHRLTVRQRAALAWQASGLVQVDIARRMGTTPQNLRNLQVAAHRRLERLALRGGGARRSRPARAHGDIEIAWDQLEFPPAPGAVQGRDVVVNGGNMNAPVCIALAPSAVDRRCIRWARRAERIPGRSNALVVATEACMEGD